MLAVTGFATVACIINTILTYRENNRAAAYAWGVAALFAFGSSIRHLTEFLKSS
jgi:hypothetical protein